MAQHWRLIQPFQADNVMFFIFSLLFLTAFPVCYKNMLCIDVTTNKTRGAQCFFFLYLHLLLFLCRTVLASHASFKPRTQHLFVQYKTSTRLWLMHQIFQAGYLILFLELNKSFCGIECKFKVKQNTTQIYILYIYIFRTPSSGSFLVVWVQNRTSNSSTSGNQHHGELLSSTD